MSAEAQFLGLLGLLGVALLLALIAPWIEKEGPGVMENLTGIFWWLIWVAFFREKK